MNSPTDAKKDTQKTRKPWVLYGSSSLFTIFYMLFIIDEGIAFNFSNIESSTSFLLFLFYLTAFTISWFKEKTAGYLFVSWYVIMMALATHVWTNAGMTIILGFPVLPIGIFYVLSGYKKSQVYQPKLHQMWNLALRILISTYAAIYIIVITSSFVALSKDGLASEPFIYLELLFVLFLVGFVFAFRNELIAGIILISWYIAILVFVYFFPMLRINMDR